MFGGESVQYKVIVVDNSNYDLRHYSSMSVFEECGFEMCSHTSEPMKAIDAAANGECDLILCINRPTAVIAAELLKRASKAGVNVPTLVISQVNAANDMRECFLLGAIDYLIEPVMDEDIRSALIRARKAVGKKIMAEEFERAMQKAVSAIPAAAKNESFIAKLRELLENAQGGALTVEAAADHFGFNPDYFGRYFKQRTGIAFSEFYKRLTMDYAGQLLASGHYKVHEVSDMLGFASPDYFTRVFKKITGRLPSSFRR